MKNYWTMLLVIASPSLATADIVYGSVTRGGRPLPGVEVEISCDNQTYKGRTGNDGAYSITIGTTGSCVAKITHENHQYSKRIHSYPDPTKYDLELDGMQ